MSNLFSNLIATLRMIKFEHTIFVLPFAYLAALLGSYYVRGGYPSGLELLWITLAMIGARSSAMAFNRLIDLDIDSRNPRTIMRELVRGTLSSRYVFWFALVGLLLLAIAACNLNRMAVYCLPIALLFLVGYSYTKRFTYLCHLVLGIATGFGALGAWIAVAGEVGLAGSLIFGTVAFWIAGFDIIYACQDVDFDREASLFSIPARFGIARALMMSRLLHLLMLVCLFIFIWLMPLTWISWIGYLLVSLIIFYEHIIISEHDLSRLDIAFFTLNGFVSIVLFLMICLDLFWFVYPLCDFAT